MSLLSSTTLTPHKNLEVHPCFTSLPPSQESGRQHEWASRCSLRAPTLQTFKPKHIFFLHSPLPTLAFTVFCLFVHPFASVLGGVLRFFSIIILIFKVHVPGTEGKQGSEGGRKDRPWTLNSPEYYSVIHSPRPGPERTRNHKTLPSQCEPELIITDLWVKL